MTLIRPQMRVSVTIICIVQLNLVTLYLPNLNFTATLVT